MEIIDEFCREYKKITEELLSAAEKDDFEKMDELLSSRQELMDKLSMENYDKPTLADALNTQGIVELELRLTKLLEEKRNSFTDSISNIEKNKKANQAYIMTSLNRSQSILSKRI
jgi:uncharacterized membrane protein